MRQLSTAPCPAQSSSQPPPQTQPGRPEQTRQESPVCACGSQNSGLSSGSGIFSFLRRLIPRQIDTDDLLIILLILLMNREEDSGGLSPLLTLALYFLL